MSAREYVACPHCGTLNRERNTCEACGKELNEPPPVKGIRLEFQEVRDALAEVGITGPVARKLTDSLNVLIEQKVQELLMANDPLNLLLRQYSVRKDHGPI